MRIRTILGAILGISVLGLLRPIGAHAQTATDLAALKGLAPVTVLSKNDTGNAALGSNYAVTGGIQTGTIILPTPWPFPEQQQQALRDVFMTTANLAQLADGLGTTLGSAYLARAHYVDRTDASATQVSASVAEVIAYATATTQGNASSGKYFFANETTNGKTPASPHAKAILTSIKGKPDMFGQAYGLPAGKPGADAYGNSRPFQTQPSLTRFTGPDYFAAPSDNIVYNRGPMMDLINSPSYPSGHTTYGYTGSVVLAVLVPERYAQMMTRAAEYGTDRIIMGAHYAMDVLGGRTLALYDMAHLLANDPAYVGQTLKNTKVVIKDFRDAVKRARADLVAVLESSCGGTVAACAAQDTGRFSSQAHNQAFYDSTLTYDLPVVYSKTAAVREDVAKLAPEAGYLLTVAFPSLTLDQANQILTETEGPGGGFLDDGSPFGVYSRLNLYAAAKRAEQVAGGR
jgi:hypothetical protein